MRHEVEDIGAIFILCLHSDPFLEALQHSQGKFTICGYLLLQLSDFSVNIRSVPLLDVLELLYELIDLQLVILQCAEERLLAFDDSSPLSTLF